MLSMTENSYSISFKVDSLREIPNPYVRLGETTGDKNCKMYVAICDIVDIPDNIPMDTNPREQKLTTQVAKAIKDSLVDEYELNFYLLNRGMLLSANEVHYNSYTRILTIDIADEDVHGNVDGGHTYKIIRENKDNIEPGNQFVKLEILTGTESIFPSLAAARNKSTPVKEASIANLEERYKLIKDALKDEPFANSIYYEENGDGDINVEDITAILNMFNIDRYPNKDKMPTCSYSGKSSCTKYYIEQHKLYADGSENPYIKMKNIMGDIFRLYDLIEKKAHTYYSDAVLNGKYGSVKGVKKPKKNKVQAKFSNDYIDYQSPTGFIYPILGAFRALVVEGTDGMYQWKNGIDPFKVLDQVGPELLKTTVERSRSLGNNPQQTGKDNGNWQTLYMQVAFSQMD